MKKIKGYVSNFFVDYNIIDTSNIINTHNYLTKKNDIQICLVLLQTCLPDVTGIVNA